MFLTAMIFQATLLVSVAFFVLFAATHATSWVMRFGIGLSIVLVIASAFLLAAPLIEGPPGGQPKFKVVGYPAGFEPPFAERRMAFAPQFPPPMVYCGLPMPQFHDDWKPSTLPLEIVPQNILPKAAR